MIGSGWSGLLLVSSLLAASGASAGQGGVRSPLPYDAAVIGGAYAAGEAIGTAAVNGHGGYDGGMPTGYGGGPGPADRPCFVRRPVYDRDGTLIGYRGTQLC